MQIPEYSTRSMLKDIWRFIKPYKQDFLIGSIARLTSDVVWLFPVWAISEIITLATGYTVGAPLTYFYQLMIAVGLVALYHFWAHDYCKYLIYQVAERVSIDAQLTTLQHLYTLDTHWQQSENSGKKIKRISKGGESLNNVIRVYVDLVIESVVNLVGILFIFGSLSWWHLAIMLVFYATYFVLSQQLTLKARNQAHMANLAAEELDGVVFETVNHISTVKSLGIAEQMRPWLAGKAQDLMDAIRKRIVYFRTRSGVLNIYQEIFRQLLLWLTCFAVFTGSLEVGTIALVLLYFGKIEESAFELAETYNSFIIAKIGVQRMKEILELEPTVELTGTEVFPKNWQTLSLRDLSFSYEGQAVLQGVTLDIKRGEKIGIVGISGTGKSTLFKLLLKLYTDYKGEIYFDKIPLTEIDRSTYIPHTAVVPQETELFNLSLADNITLAAPNKLTDNRKDDRQTLQNAIEVAHVADFLPKLTEGVDTLIGEKGVRLSGGERQRVGIARAVYRGPDILFLDEATSHLDTVSETKIQEALHEFLETTTAVVIAHRLSTLQEMDRIVVMDQGQIVQEGKFNELQQNPGPFKELWEQQTI